MADALGRGPMYATIRKLLAGACFAALALSASVASAQSELLGLWRGYGQSSYSPNGTPPGPPELVSLLVPAVQRGLFRGSLVVEQAPGPPNLFNVTGFAGANGSLNGLGRDAAGETLLFTGRQRALGDGSVRLASFFYFLLGRNGALMDYGFDVFVQMQGGLTWQAPGPPNLTGLWSGEYQSSVGPGGGLVTADLASVLGESGAPTSAFHGASHWFTPPGSNGGSFDATFGMQGTVGLPAVQDQGLEAPFASVMSRPPPVGSPEGGIIAILIGTWKNPGPAQVPAVQGQYRMYSRFFDVFLDIVNGSGSPFDQGTFSLPAVQ